MNDSNNEARARFTLRDGAERRGRRRIDERKKSGDIGNACLSGIHNIFISHENVVSSNNNLASDVSLFVA